MKELKDELEAMKNRVAAAERNATSMDAQRKAAVAERASLQKEVCDGCGWWIIMHASSAGSEVDHLYGMLSYWGLLLSDLVASAVLRVMVWPFYLLALRHVENEGSSFIAFGSSSIP